MTTRAPLSFLLAAALLGGCSSASSSPSSKAPRHVALLTDRSPSIEDGHGSSCTGVRWMLGKALESPGVGPHSHVQAFTTGNGVGNSIIPLGAPMVMPPPLTSDQDQLRLLLLQRGRKPIEAACAQLTPSETSPLWLALRDTVAQMQSWGCDDMHPCTLWMQTDLQETDDLGIRQALRAKTGAKLPAPLRAPGINVSACGLGASTERVDAALRARTEEVWGQLVPGMTFAPICG